MQVELTRFRVRKGQEERAVEWMRFLRQNMDAVEQTLAPEKNVCRNDLFGGS